MRKLRQSLVGMLACPSNIALVQGAASQVRAAAEQGVVYSTGSMSLVDYVDFGVEESGAGGVGRWHGLTAATAMESTDPRLAGAATVVWNVDSYAGYDGPEWGTVRIENDGGAWQGTYSGISIPDDEVEWFVAYIATSEGEGGYEGLVSVCHWYIPGGGWNAQIKCVVMPGDLADFEGLATRQLESPAE